MTKSCTTCAHGGRPRANYPCNICGLTMGRDEAIPSMYAEKEDPMTNADHLCAMRAEGVEVLAKFFEENGMFECHLCSEFDRLEGNAILRWQSCDQKCFEHCLEWLQQPWGEE